MQLHRAFYYIQGSGTQPIPTNVTRYLIEQSRLKAGTIWKTKGNVKNLADLRRALSTGLSIGVN